MLARAIEAEVACWIDEHAHLTDEAAVARSSATAPTPSGLLTGSERWPSSSPESRIAGLPREGEFPPERPAPVPPADQDHRRAIPWLYLKGISTGDFPEALQALFGSEAKRLSANTVTRLKASWEEEHRAWSKRSLKGKHYVYVRADGVHFNIRLEEGRQCILVLFGATADGKKELIAITDGYRESEQSWKELLLDCKSRGLDIEPSLAIGDGALGFWAAMRKVWHTTKEQRCWVHKTANVLDKLPKSSQPKAKSQLHDIYLADTKADADKAFDLFMTTYEAKHPKAIECLEKDRKVLLAFYDFPAEQWPHIRTTNPIESTFATVRLRHTKTKGSGTRTACLAMVYKLMETASKKWRALNGSVLLQEVIAGAVFVDGVMKPKAA